MARVLILLKNTAFRTLLIRGLTVQNVARLLLWLKKSLTTCCYSKRHSRHGHYYLCSSKEYIKYTIIYSLVLVKMGIFTWFGRTVDRFSDWLSRQWFFSAMKNWWAGHFHQPKFHYWSISDVENVKRVRQ